MTFQPNGSGAGGHLWLKRSTPPPMRYLGSPRIVPAHPRRSFVKPAISLSLSISLYQPPSLPPSLSFSPSLCRSPSPSLHVPDRVCHFNDERRGNNLKKIQDFNLNAKAGNWPSLICMCRVRKRSTLPPIRYVGSPSIFPRSCFPYERGAPAAGIKWLQ